MADVHYQGFVPHRPPVPMVRSLSFHGLPTAGHGAWPTPAAPLDIPGASPPRRPRRLPYLLSVSVPDNADAVLSRSLLEQCRLDSISDSSPRSSSLKHYGSWASRVFSDGASSNKASLSTCASSNAAQEDVTENGTRASLVGTDNTKFTKKGPTEKRPEPQASALSAALRGSYWKEERGRTTNMGERTRIAPSHNGQVGHQWRGQILKSGHDDPKNVGLPLWQARADGQKQAAPSLTPPVQGLSPAMSCTSSTSSTRTDWDRPDPSSSSFIARSGHKQALLDRLMEYCYAILANNYTEVKGDASTSCAPSSTSSSQRASGQVTTYSEQRSHAKSKKRSSHNESDASGDSDDDEGNGGLASKRVKMDENMGKRLACPFFKRNPQRYQEERSCVGPGWVTLHRLKEHLYRCHTLPIHCLRCHEIFATEELLQVHSLSDTPCHRRRPENEPGPVLEGIGLAQERRLRSRKRTNKTEEDKWRDAYKICFPDDILVPSPYYEIPALSDSITSTSSCGLMQYEDFVRTELPRRVRRELDRRLEQEWIPIEERLRSQLSDMMRDIQLTLLEEFRRRGRRATTTTTESLPASTPASTNQPDGTPPTPPPPPQQRRRHAPVADSASSSSVGAASMAAKSATTTFMADMYGAASPPPPPPPPPTFAEASDVHDKAAEHSGNYAGLDTEIPFFEPWGTLDCDTFILSRNGGMENLNWAGNEGAYGCVVPDVEDWARSWGNKA